MITFGTVVMNANTSTIKVSSTTTTIPVPPPTTTITPSTTTTILNLSAWAKVYTIKNIYKPNDHNSGYAESIQQTGDGGYILAGTVYLPNDHTWVMKLDGNGDISWQRFYSDGALHNEANSIQQTKDGGYIVAGRNFFPSGTESNFLIVKLDASGNVTWQKVYGGSGADAVRSIQQTSDGGYIVAGYTFSFGAGDENVWVIKLDNYGDMSWQKTYSVTDPDYARLEPSSIQETSGGGYIIVSDFYIYAAGAEHVGFGVTKLNKNGDIVWQRTYGDVSLDFIEANSIQQTIDGGYVVAGLISIDSKAQAWVIKLDNDGDIVWQKVYKGVESYSTHRSIKKTFDGGYILLGEATTASHGSYTFLLKLDADGNISWQKTIKRGAYDIIYSIQQTNDSKYIMAGSSSTSGYGDRDPFVLKLDSKGEISGCEIIDTCDYWADNTSVVSYQINVIVESINVVPYDASVYYGEGLLAEITTICEEESTTTTTIGELLDCYVDPSCTTDYYVRSCVTGACVSIEKCYNLWACADACNGISCGDGLEECVFNPVCSSDVQTCGQNGYCISISSCTDRIHSDMLSHPYPCSDITTTVIPSTSTTTTIEGDTCISESLYGEHSNETERLRYFRDNILSTTPEGQELIRLYYEWSPVIVEMMNEDEEFKAQMKEMMDEVVEVISSK